MNVNKTNSNKLKLDIFFLIINIILTVFVVLLFSGCVQKEIVTQREEVKKIPLNLSDPHPLKLNDVSYAVITDKNSKDVFDQMIKESKEPVLFGIDSKDYENLSLNLSYIRKYIIEQQQIIKSYRDYYEPDSEEVKPQKLEINIDKN
jgi:hypothetical protein